MRKRFATRGVIHSWANPDGTQKIELTGPLNKKRMETVDEEFTREAIRFLEESKKEDKPFFLWWNSTRMHIWTRLKAESQGKTGLGIYPTAWSSTTRWSGSCSTSSRSWASKTTPS